jgi:hypothetical protein
MRDLQRRRDRRQWHRALPAGVAAAEGLGMSLKAILTTILLGTSSVALAAPSYGQPDVRDHRMQPIQAQAPAFQRVAWHRPDVARPITLASSERINGRQIIKVNESLRAFSKLELRARSGRTDLDKVVVTFGNGQTQTIDCNRQLSANESFTIDLAGKQRNVKRIVLVGRSGRRGSLDVIAL